MRTIAIVAPTVTDLHHPGKQSATTNRATRRHSPEVRRGLIVAAARPLLAAQGLAHTTMRQIAETAGVSLGTLSYHFTGLDEVLAEVIAAEMEWFYQPVVDTIDDGLTAREALHRVIESLLASDEATHEHWRLWLDFWSLAAHDEAFAERHAEAYARWRTDLLTVFDRGARDGSLRVDDRDAAVTDLMALLDGLATHAFLPGQGLRVPQARGRLHDFVDALPTD